MRSSLTPAAPSGFIARARHTLHLSVHLLPMLSLTHQLQEHTSWTVRWLSTQHPAPSTLPTFVRNNRWHPSLSHGPSTDGGFVFFLLTNNIDRESLRKDPWAFRSQQKLGMHSHLLFHTATTMQISRTSNFLVSLS